MLKAGDWQAELRPEIGGSIAALRYRGNDVLRPMPPDTDQPLDASCFPLVPFCNRIRNGRFTFDKREMRLPANHLPEPHALHGAGWQRVWQMEILDSASACLTHDYDGSGEWPWAYRVQQILTLTDVGLKHELIATNLSDTPAPMGLGLHPYFRRRPGTQVQFSAKSVVLVGSDMIPTGDTESPNHFADWQAGSRLPESLIDHTHRDWNGTATITDDLGTITLRAKGAAHLHIYAPTDGKTLCCEPVTHSADALNQDPAEMVVLQPGASTRIVMNIGAA